MARLAGFGWLVAALCLTDAALAFSPSQHTSSPVCRPANPGFASCDARTVADQRGATHHFASASAAGYGPQQFRTAYGVSGVAASGTPVIAVVAAYGNPVALDDLNTYSAEFGTAGLPACQSNAMNAAACFRAVNQHGGSKLPKPDPGWALIQALDIELAHALCENCSILLVEANTNSIHDLGTAENTAARRGATVIANSWGAGENAGERNLDKKYFAHPGVAMAFSAGSSGFGLTWPAASPTVTAVGGTTLLFNDDGSYKEELSYGNGGCSQYERRPTWQKKRAGCPNRRTDVDIAADADPATGAAIYSSTGCSGDCWVVVGGTAISSPIIAGIFALANNIPPGETQASRILYENASPSNIHDITKGPKGDCAFKYMCQAVKGYDAPTGLGTPNGLGAF